MNFKNDAGDGRQGAGDAVEETICCFVLRFGNGTAEFVINLLDGIGRSQV